MTDAHAIRALIQEMRRYVVLGTNPTYVCSQIHLWADALQNHVTPGCVHPPLIQYGQFVLHSGLFSGFKIDCDAFSADELAAVAAWLTKLLPVFGCVEGVPRGGLRLADALLPYSTPGGPLLIVDDVLTTGASLEAQRAGRDAYGAVIFARGPCPQWVMPLFTVARPA